jgi:hypothetical protein
MATPFVGSGDFSIAVDDIEGRVHCRGLFTATN